MYKIEYRKPDETGFNETEVFLEYANEAAAIIKEIYHVCGGYKGSAPEEGTLLGGVYDLIYEMVSVYLAPILGKELHGDDLNDITVEILRADKDEISNIVEKYCKAVA